MPRVNPDILRWARETAGLGLAEAARKLQIRDTKSAAGEERLAALEAGEAKPSRTQLVKMSKQYRRPLLTFYLGSVPETGRRGLDLRTLPHPSQSEEAILDSLIRDIWARQGLVRVALEDDEDAAPLPLVGSMSQQDGVSAVVASLQRTLGFDLAEFRRAPDPEAAFKLLRDKAQDVGIFVLLQGNLGSYHTALSVDTFRGFALADPIAPFVVINDEDSRSAWSFTLVHELAHVWLGQTAISGGPPEQAVERFCNEVASQLLLPAEDIRRLRLPQPVGARALEAEISGFAQERNLSRSMVAYRLYRDGIIHEAVWLELHRNFRAQWLAHRRQQRRLAREREGGVDYYVVRRHRLGTGLLQVAGRLLDSRALPTSKVAQVLGVKPKQVGPLLTTVPGGIR